MTSIIIFILLHKYRGLFHNDNTNMILKFWSRSLRDTINNNKEKHIFLLYYKKIYYC